MALLAATAIPGEASQALQRAAVTAAGAVLAWLISMAPALLVGIARKPPPSRLRSPASPTWSTASAATTHPQPGTPPSTRCAEPGRPWNRPGATETTAWPASSMPPRTCWKRRCDRRWRTPNLPIRAWPPRSAPPSPSSPPRPTPEPTPHRPGHRTRTPWPRPSATCTPPSAANTPCRRPSTRQIRTHNHQGIGTRMRAAAGRHSVIVPTAARIGIAVAAGFGLGQAFGIAHAFWIGLTACAVLQASNLRIVRSRFVNRMVGTILGVGIVFSLLAWEPPLIALILTAIVAHGFIESVITAHYGLAVVGMTVLALMLFHLGAPAEDTSSPDRRAAHRHRPGRRPCPAPSNRALAPGDLGPGTASTGNRPGFDRSRLRRHLDARPPPQPTPRAAPATPRRHHGAPGDNDANT